MEDIGVDGRLDIDGQRRRFQAMRPWIADLEVIPLSEIEVPANALSRMSMKAAEKISAKGESKLIEKRNKP